MRWWDPHYRGLFIEFMQALGKEFDSHPALEFVVVGVESTHGMNSYDEDYPYDPVVTSANNIDHWKAMGTGVKAAFPRTAVTVSINFGLPLLRGRRGFDPAVYDDWVAWAAANKVGLSAPDLIPYCSGNENYDGIVDDPDCNAGWPTVGPGTKYHHNPMYDAIIRDGTNDYVNAYRIAGSDQAGRNCDDITEPYITDSGCSGTGQVSGNPAATLIDFVNTELKSQYMWWVIEGGSRVRYAAADRIQGISSTPLTHSNTLECPASSCQ